MELGGCKYLWNRKIAREAGFIALICKEQLIINDVGVGMLLATCVAQVRKQSWPGATFCLKYCF